MECRSLLQFFARKIDRAIANRPSANPAQNWRRRPTTARPETQGLRAAIQGTAVRATTTATGVPGTTTVGEALPPLLRSRCQAQVHQELLPRRQDPANGARHPRTLAGQGVVLRGHLPALGQKTGYGEIPISSGSLIYTSGLSKGGVMGLESVLLNRSKSGLFRTFNTMLCILCKCFFPFSVDFANLHKKSIWYIRKKSYLASFRVDSQLFSRLQYLSIYA